jgi:hypothetical protein
METFVSFLLPVRQHFVGCTSNVARVFLSFLCASPPCAFSPFPLACGGVADLSSLSRFLSLVVCTIRQAAKYTFALLRCLAPPLPFPIPFPSRAGDWWDGVPAVSLPLPLHHHSGGVHPDGGGHVHSRAVPADRRPSRPGHAGKGKRGGGGVLLARKDGAHLRDGNAGGQQVRSAVFF